MEINFTEIKKTDEKMDGNNRVYQNSNSNSNSNSNTYLTTKKYWEKGEEEENTSIKRKKISFDDILSNMNLVVNQSGVLQKITIKKHIDDEEDRIMDGENTIINQNNYTNNNYTNEYSNKQHSYIHNKYFKDYYNDTTNSPPEIRVPKTIEEYKQMLLEDKIKRIEHKKRISEIKPTKLLFTTNSNSYINNPSNNTIHYSGKQNLKKMIF